MSSNGSTNNRTYNSIYLKKSTYDTYNGGTVIRKFKVKKGEHKGKIAHVTIKTDENGKEVLSFTFKTGN